MKNRPKVTPNLIDRVVGVFSPASGLKRLHARAQLMAATGGYNGGARDRRPTKRWRPPQGSANADTLLDLGDLRARSRELARNTPLATGALATVTTETIGAGLQLQACIDHEALGITPERADEMEREQEREFALFCLSADFTRVQKFGPMQVLAFRSKKESGDVLVIRRYRKDAGDVYGTKLQLLEADRLSNPNHAQDTDEISGGVETNVDGVPVAYHISNRHPGAIRATALIWEKIAARTDEGLPVVLHQFDRTRPELTRGVPFLAPVIEHLKQLGDYSDAEVTAAVISAMFTMVIETPNDEDGDGNPVIGEKDSSLEANEVKLGNGAVISLAPGEEVKTVNPARPNANFDPFWLAFCRQIGVALELPFELLIKHFTASYTASRAALELARRTFLKERSFFGDDFCQEIYGWQMDEAVALGRLARPGYFADPVIRQAYLGAEWIGPRAASLNPKQEAEADAVDVDNGFKTIEQVCIERTGGEFEKKNDQRGKEVKMRKAVGAEKQPPSAFGAAQSAPTPDAEDDGSDEEEQQNRSAAQ